MKIRVPHYYKDFKCIANECTDTCCAGWEVDVDKESAEYYKTVTGEFGERIKSVMVMHEDGEAHFTLKPDRWCPFLNKTLYCDLYTALGEEHLCDTCANYPRFIEEYGATREIGLALSCKTAGELILRDDTPMTFEVSDDGKPLTTYNDMDPDLFFYLDDARRTAYGMARNRAYSVKKRYYGCLLYAKDLMKDIKKKKYSGICTSYKIPEMMTLEFHPTKDSIKAMWEGFSQLEIINTDWSDAVADVYKYLHDGVDENAYMQAYCDFDEYYKDYQYEYEHLLMYFLYRYMLKAINDRDVLTKIKLACVSYIFIKELDIARWLKNGKCLTKTEQVDLMHLYSRQVEHSYENFDGLCNLCAKDKRFDTEILERILKQ